MSDLHKDYLKETFAADGSLSAVSFSIPQDFNFAYDVVDRIARAEPERRALEWCNVAGEEKTLSFGDVARESDRAASFFRSIGIGRGDRVMLILKRHYQFWFAAMALHKLGAVCIPATNQLQVKDLVYRFEAASVKAVVCTAEGEIASHVETAVAQCPAVKVRVLVRGERAGWLSYARGTAEAAPFVRPAGADAPVVSDTMLLYFTSGTTGLPKMVSHDYSYPLGHIVTAKHWHNVVPDGLHFTVSETGWAKSVWGKLYGQWLMEAGIFVFDFDRFVPAELLARIEKYRITTFCAPPTIYRFLIKEDLTRYDLSSLRYVTIAGEALNPEVFDQFLRATGLKLMEGFGQTETTVQIANFPWMEPKPGSMGRPNPMYDILLSDEVGNEVRAGQVGEICIRTGAGRPVGMFGGYLQNDELTVRVWHDGVYHTGDMAWRDEDGYYWYVGRDDDIIKSSGYRIGPFEVESVLMEHPAVLECAVIGVPDPVRTQVVKATVVPAKGYVPSEALALELQEYVKTHTAPYKYPRILEFATELPKTISGKIRRTEIRARHQDKGESSQGT
jgi:acetyl-CoA synthetase